MMKMSSLRLQVSLMSIGGVAASLALTSCAKEQADRPGAALGQGTLGLSQDGSFAVSVYPDSGRIELFDLKKDKLSQVIAIEGKSRLGRVTMSDTSAYVTDRHSGTILKVDLEDGDVEKSSPLCREPRGSALSRDGELLHVACADGQLVSVSADSLEMRRSLQMGADLRDVEIFEDGLVLSRFRTAEVMVIDEDGKVTETFKPADDTTLGKAGVAWRMNTDGDNVYLMYQFMSETPLGGGPGGYYGNGCSFQVVRPALARLKRGDTGELEAESVVTLNGAAGALDFAVSEGKVAVAVPGNAWSPRPRASLIVWDSGAMGPGHFEDNSACQAVGSGSSFGSGSSGRDEAEVSTEREAPMAVALSVGGAIVTQSSEGGLRKGSEQKWIGGDHSGSYDRGRRLFHMSTDLGIACVSCHPDGGDDGHVWNFAAFGLRRSQNLRGGLSDRKVFHWSGDLPTVSALMNEVFVGRMGLSNSPSTGAQDDLVRYLDTLPGEASASSDDEAAVERGRELFEVSGCGKCHSGPRYTDGVIYDVGTGGKFVTPSLLGVHVRAPYLHDGCAETLHDRFGACGGGDKHGKTSQLLPSHVDDLVAFLESL